MEETEWVKKLIAKILGQLYVDIVGAANLLQ